jgi:hypothetical protein
VPAWEQANLTTRLGSEPSLIVFHTTASGNELLPNPFS